MATFKQKLTAKHLVENGGNIGAAMRAAGYSKATAKTPQKLTLSKGWQDLMDDIFPDKALLIKHRQLLNAKKTIFVGNKKYLISDNVALAKALDLAYKLKGKYIHNEEEKRQFEEFDGWTQDELSNYATKGEMPEGKTINVLQ